MISYNELLNTESSYLKSSFLTHHEFKLLFSSITGKDFNPINASEIDDQSYSALIEKLERRKSGEPIQYILGNWPFVDIDLIVDQRALIPRPETENLAVIAEHIAHSFESPIITDLCAGSGAIALYLKHKLSDSVISAVEISSDACSLINENINNLKLDIEIIESDVLDYLKNLPDCSVDIFVSNPPYVTEYDYQTNYNELMYEPEIAFISSDEGLFFYNKMTPLCFNKLKKSGFLLYEIGEDQGNLVKDIMLNAGFSDVSINKDIFGLDRYVSGKKN